MPNLFNGNNESIFLIAESIIQEEMSSHVLLSTNEEAEGKLVGHPDKLVGHVPCRPYLGYATVKYGHFLMFKSVYAIIPPNL